MPRLTTGRVEGDQCLHVVTSTAPPYALCGAGMVVARIAMAFPVGDPSSCRDCAALVDDRPDGPDS